MSIERALARLAAPGALLAQVSRGNGFGVFPQGDRRRRPSARLNEQDVRALVAEGALERSQEGYVLSEAGHHRVRRDGAREGERHLAQHAAVIDRAVMDREGDASTVRSVESSAVLRRLAALRDLRGAPWLSGAELRAAADLYADWEQAQVGLVRGSDWRAPPRGSAPRGRGSDAAMAARCDARRRMQSKLDALAAPLRRAVERVCLYNDGIEALERSEGWPQRSGKLALKLGLAQLARCAG